ncbi:DUF1836 domain-containing protein [Ornithinibacillus halotolerans]|uniref:DUF1836 domain-containing protein n=1 Tax=Ornithinibacillus halotolerans TaxID=1274357 RepID=A0A916RYQ9_9BACI|nr:DUF1836 domain-containing protein [Ornithinibacillus halotolerans]GGA77085.1 hypothetical protein GCM10008025_20880 [Ornithinibacillus halotolerans]
MKNIESAMEDLNLNNQLLIEEIPDLDLYMDQVIQIFENKFSNSKRNPDDKVLTKTMINNYAKGKLFFPIENKKYTKKHLILISLIYQLKGALSINDIKITLNRLNELVSEEFDVERLYRSYLKLSEYNTDRFENDVTESIKGVTKEASEFEDENAKYIEQLLMITSLVNMSNYYRRLAEKLVDELQEESNSKKLK